MSDKLRLTEEEGLAKLREWDGKPALQGPHAWSGSARDGVVSETAHRDRLLCLVAAKAGDSLRIMEIS